VSASADEAQQAQILLDLLAGEMIDDPELGGFSDLEIVDSPFDEGRLRELLGAALEETGAPLVPCCYCERPWPRSDVHLHQGGYIGGCCWDERLRASE
jgi:hypothetical protein